MTGPADLPEDIREVLLMYLDVPEDQREGFEDLSAPVNLMLEARGEQPAS